MRRAYLTHVPELMDEKTFWTRYCRAQYYKRVRKGGAAQGNRHENHRQDHRQDHRQEPTRQSHGGKGDSIQGVAFLHRESRPAKPASQPNRNQRPQR